MYVNEKQCHLLKERILVFFVIATFRTVRAAVRAQCSAPRFAPSAPDSLRSPYRGSEAIYKAKEIKPFWIASSLRSSQ